MLSAKMVAIPTRADTSIQTRAPGPPATSAVATPTIFPVPMVAARVVIRAEKGETPLFFEIRASFPKALRRANLNRRQGRNRIRRVKNKPVPSSKARVPGPHSRSLMVCSIVCSPPYPTRYAEKCKKIPAAAFRGSREKEPFTG